MKKFLFLLAILAIVLISVSPVSAAPTPQIDPLCLLEKIVSGDGVSWATNLDSSILIHLNGGPEAVALSAYLNSQGWKNVAHSNFSGRIENWERPDGWKPPSSCNGGQGAGGGETPAEKFNRLVGSTVLGTIILGVIGLIGMLGGRRLSPSPA